LFVWLLFIALLIKIARHFCLAHRLIRSLYCSVFKESSLFKRLDYLTTIRYFLSSTSLKFFEGILHRGRRSRGDRYDDTMDGGLCQLVFLSFLLICMERFLRWTRPGAVRVLRFDSACGAEGCGIAIAGDEYFAACGGENHTTAPAARSKCTPIPLRGLPPEGEVLAAHYLELLMSSTAEQRVKFPLRGKGGALAPKGVHFQRPPGRLCGFNYIFIAANDSSVPSSFDSSLPKLIPYKFFSSLLQ